MTQSDTQVNILQSAITVFTKYGVRRASMADVAQHAGVSRQTLYGHFKNKDEIAAAALSHALVRILDDIRRSWADAADLGEVLDVYFQHAVIAPYDAMMQMPDFKDLLQGVGPQMSEAAQSADASKMELLEARLLPLADVFAKTGNTPKSVTKLIVRTSSELKFSQIERDELVQLLATLKTAILALAR